MNIPSIKLNNGVSIPQLGYGTFKSSNEEAETGVLAALESGYRHIDTALIYGNEKGVGNALEKSDIPREKIFLVSKLWNDDQGYDSTLRAFEVSLGDLKTDYLDLYLIHWPKPLNKETWRAMEKLYNEKRIRAIGVSNFREQDLEELFDLSDIVPVLNQVELHPQFPQEKLREFCQKKGILIEAWGPLMQGKIFDIPLMKELAIKYSKSIAQIALRWHIQSGIITIPKSVNPERIKGNIDIFDFEISSDDMRAIGSLNSGERIGVHPDDVYNGLF